MLKDLSTSIDVLRSTLDNRMNHLNGSVSQLYQHIDSVIENSTIQLESQLNTTETLYQELSLNISQIQYQTNQLNGSVSQLYQHVNSVIENSAIQLESRLNGTEATFTGYFTKSVHRLHIRATFQRKYKVLCSPQSCISYSLLRLLLGHGLQWLCCACVL